MKWTPADIVVAILAGGIAVGIALTAFGVSILGRPVQPERIEVLRLVLVGVISIISGYVAGKHKE